MWRELPEPIDTGEIDAFGDKVYQFSEEVPPFEDELEEMENIPPTEQEKKEALARVKILASNPAFIQAFKEGMQAIIKNEEEKLAAIELQLQALENEKNNFLVKERELSGEEKYKLTKERMELSPKLKEIEIQLLVQKNVVQALQNGGDISEITDKRGIKHPSVADFTRVQSDSIIFEKETILSMDKPAYIPFIDEYEFRMRGYVLDSMRIGSDLYLTSISGYKEGIENYVLQNLDQLVLTNQYYYVKAEGKNLQEANEKNARSEAQYDALPSEKREKFLNQSNIYASLPERKKKTITREAYEALNWQVKEKIHKFFQRVNPKRLVSKLDETHMWLSTHTMYEQFVNPEALPPQPRMANEEVWKYWVYFRTMMQYKIKDLKIQREDIAENYSQALETSFGDSNVDTLLKESDGILVKRQNGDKINATEIAQIQTAWREVQNVFGFLKPKAEEYNLKISHTGKRYVFASNAVGVYVPSMRTIAVSDKFGNTEFKNILAHEIGHWIDNFVGKDKGHRFATDNYESLAGRIAFIFRDHLNKKTDSDYINATKECFARAMEMHFAISKHGPEADLIYSFKELAHRTLYTTADNFVSLAVYEEKIKPLIFEFLQENDIVVSELLPVDSEQPSDNPQPTTHNPSLNTAMTTEEKIKSGEITVADLVDQDLKDLYENVSILTDNFTDFSDADSIALFNTLVEETDRQFSSVNSEQLTVNRIDEVQNFVKVEEDKPFNANDYKDGLALLPPAQRTIVKFNSTQAEEKEFFQDLLKKLDAFAKLIQKRPSANGIVNYMVYLRYFFADTNWLICEYYPKEDTFYGYVVLNGDLEMAEYGPISISEIFGLKKGITTTELDFYFEPKSIAQSLRELYPSKFPSEPIVENTVQNEHWKLIPNGIISKELLESKEIGYSGSAYYHKKVMDWDVDDFTSYVNDYTKSDANTIDTSKSILSVIFQPDATWQTIASGLNQDKNWNKYHSGPSALYDIWEEVLSNSLQKYNAEMNQELKTDLNQIKQSVAAISEQLAVNSNQLSVSSEQLPVTSEQLPTNNEKPTTDNRLLLTEQSLATLEKAVENNSQPSTNNGQLTLSTQDIIDRYSSHITEDEIKAWVWYKRSFGNPMHGWEKYFISNNKSGKAEVLCYATRDTNLLDNRWQLVRSIQAGTLIGRKTRFANEYQGINFVVVKSENEELLFVDEDHIREEDLTFKTDQSEIDKLVQSKALIYSAGELLPIPVFQFGDMYEREAQLVADKAYILENLGQAHYDFYQILVNESKPKMLRFDDIVKSNRPRITVLGAFANDVTLMSVEELNEITGVKLERAKKRGRYDQNQEPFTLQEAFVFWLNEVVRDSDLKNTSKINIKEYYLKAPRFSVDMPESEKEEIKNNAKQAAEELFCDFLATALLPNDLFKLNVLWNKTYNQFGAARYDRVPVGFECSATFKNAPLQIKTVQKNGVGFLSLVNSGCLAYDVGYGKTLTAIINVASIISSGKAKRLLIAVPKPTLKNWRKELFGYWTDGTNVGFEPFKDSYFVTGILSNTRFTLNYWGALNKEDIQRLGNINKPAPENSITLVSYQGLGKIGFSQAVFDGIFSSLVDVLEDGSTEGSGSNRDREKTNQKYREMMGLGNMNTVCDIDVCGFDHLTVDESHNFNHVFERVGKDEGEGRRNLFGITVNPSTRGQKLFFLTNYLQRKYNGGVTLLTATPFTNSPLEIYSMLAMVGWESLRKYNLQNIRRFFETFIVESFEYVLNLKGELVTKPVIKAYQNKHILQKLLFNHFDYRSDPKEAGIVRPCKVNLPMTKAFINGEWKDLPADKVISTYLDMTEEQRLIQANVRKLAADTGYGKDKAGNMFKAMAMSLDNALSPFLVTKEMPINHLDLVDRSPKIKFTMECIRSVKEYHESRGESVSGQVIYSDRGKELFGYIKEYLHEEIGYAREVYFGDVKLSEVEILEGGGDEDYKEDVKEAFLKGIVKVIIGTSTIKEGINLQTKGTVLYDLYLNWNPTDVKQLEGRIHRQGNEFGYVRIVMPLVQNSMDAFVFQKLEEKQSRIADLWARGGANVLEEEGLDPEEIKFALITDANELAKMLGDKDLKIAENEIKVAEQNLSTYGTLKEYMYKYTTQKNEYVAEFKDRLIFYQNYAALTSQRKVETKVPALAKKLEVLEEKLAKLIGMINSYLNNLNNDQEIFDIIRYTNGSNVKWDIEEFSLTYRESYKFEYASYTKDNFRDLFSKVKRAEKDILKSRGLSIYDDISPMKLELESQLEAAKNHYTYLNSAEHKDKIRAQVQAELDKRAAIRGDLYQQVEKFKSTNYLLSYKADNTDRENCELPGVECCPTNGYEEIEIETEAQPSPTPTLQDYKDVVFGLEIVFEDMEESDPLYQNYKDVIAGFKIYIEDEEEKLAEMQEVEEGESCGVCQH